MARLPLIGTGQYGQVFPIIKDQTQLTTGNVDGVLLVWCHSAGSIDVTFPGDSSAVTLTFSDGDQFGFMLPSTVSITSGTWSFA